MKAKEKRIWWHQEELVYLNAELERLERLVAVRYITIEQYREYKNWIGQRVRLLERKLTKSGNILPVYTEKPVGLKEAVALKVKKEE